MEGELMQLFLVAAEAKALFDNFDENSKRVQIHLLGNLGAALYGDDDPRVVALRAKRDEDWSL